MAFSIIKYNKVRDDVYVFIQKMPGIYNRNLSLYFAYMYSIFDFRFRYSIFRNIDIQDYTNFRALEEDANPKNTDILTMLKNKNYEI